MPVDYAGFTLKPFGFFDRNPALDVPGRRRRTAPARAARLVTTAVARPGPSRRPAPLGRVARGLAVGSAAVHLLQVDATSLGSVAMVGMALACLPCAWHLGGRRPRRCGA